MPTAHLADRDICAMNREDGRRLIDTWEEQRPLQDPGYESGGR